MNRPNQNYNSNSNTAYNNSNSGNNNAKKYNFKQANSPVSALVNNPAAASKNSNHYFESMSSSQSYKNNVANVNALNETTDDDFLDISDNELIRASQVVESQLKFTNNVHHTTSNAINIFSQFSANNFNAEPAPMASQIMGPPSSTAITVGGSSRFGYGGNSSGDQAGGDAAVELKRIKAENMAKDGEVKILREKLKKLEQEIQKIRTERIEMVKKLNEQKEEDKRTLQKQIEFKELENQFKSQEIVELTMKYKVLESSVRKNSAAAAAAMITSTPSSHLASSSSTGPPTQIVSQFPPPTIHASSMLPPQSVHGSSNSNSKPNSMKRVAHESLSLSDNENENPVLHESKRPNLESNAQMMHQQQQQIKQSPVAPRQALSPYNQSSNILPPFANQQLQAANTMSKNQQQQQQTTTLNQINPKLIKSQHQLLGPSVNPAPSVAAMAPPSSRDFMRNNSTSSSNLSIASRASSFCLYRRKNQLNIRSKMDSHNGGGFSSSGGGALTGAGASSSSHVSQLHQFLKPGSSATTPIQTATVGLIISPGIPGLPGDLNQVVNSKLQQQQLELKSRLQNQSNERVYSIIESFVEMISCLSSFNSLTRQTLGTPLTTNTNSTHAQIQTLSGQLSNLLNFVKMIPNWYSSSSSSSCTPSFSNNQSGGLLSSAASSSTTTSSLSASERIEFVSNRLNEELVKLIKYCLNTSLRDGFTTSTAATIAAPAFSTTSTSGAQKLTSKATATVKQQQTLASRHLNATHRKVTTSASSLNQTSARSNQTTDANLGAHQRPSSNSPAATSISIVDLLCLAFDICHHLFLNRVTLLIVDTENAKDQLIQFLKCQNSKSSAAPSVQHTKAYDSYVKLMKLKREFFRIILYMLKSINFASPPASSLGHQSTAAAASLSSLSSSSSSYSTLKILNSIIDCFNHLYYLPISHHKLQPYSFKTFFYFSLVDNMHNIFKKMKIFYPCTSSSSVQTSKKTRRENESDQLDTVVNGNAGSGFNKSDHEMDENDEDHEGDLDDFNYDSDDVDAEETAEDEFADLNEHCLFKLFFAKTTKYFGDVVYTIDAAENSSLKQDDTAASDSSSSEQNSEDYNIITSIASDNLEDQSDYDEMMLMVQASEHGKGGGGNHSMIMSQDILELQSQIPNDDERRATSAKAEASHPANAAATATAAVSSSNAGSKSSNKSSLNREGVRNRGASASSIQLLQTQFLNQFIYFLHNYQLISSLEYSLIMFNNRMRRRRLHNNTTGAPGNSNANNNATSCSTASSMSSSVGGGMSMMIGNQHKRINIIKQFVCHNQKCMCFKEMMIGFFMLIDYQFNEKFIFGAGLFFNECFYLPVVSSSYSPLSSSSSSMVSSSRSSLKSWSDHDDQMTSSRESLVAGYHGNGGQSSRKTVKSHQDSSSDSECQQLEEKCTTTSTVATANRIHYVLILRCCNILSSLLSSREIRMNLSDSYAKHQKNLIEYQKSSEQKLKFFNTLRDDYRLKNFLCLFKLADSNYETLSATVTTVAKKTKTTNGAASKMKMSAAENNNCVVDNYAHTSETIPLHHLDSSLKLLRSHLKANFFREYFQSISSTTSDTTK